MEPVSPLPCDAATFARLWDQAAGWRVGGEAQLRGLRAAVDRAVTQLAGLTGRDLSTTLEGPESFAAYASADTITVGLGYLQLLERSSRLFSDYLLQNYCLQHINLGPVVHLPMLIAARDFPSAALGLYEGHMSPLATAAGGDFGGMRAMLGALPASGAPISVSDFRAASGWIVLPWPDIARFEAEWAERVARETDQPPFAHALLLFGRVFDAALLFILAHELAHVVLGHTTEAPGTAERSRREEVAADGWAAAFLKGTEGVDLRAVALLFAFLGQYDAETPPKDREHPFPADRLGLLTSAAASNPALRQDLNAAMRLLRRSVEVDSAEIAGMSEVSALWSADLQGTVCLELGFPGGQCDSEALCVEMALEIRDAVHPSLVHRTGHVIAPLDLAKDETFSLVENGLSKNAARRTLVLPVPPAWWLDHPDAAPAMTSVRLLSAPGCGTVDWRSDTPLDAAGVVSALKTLAVSDPVLAEAAARASVSLDPPPTAATVVQAVCDAGPGLCEDLRAWLADHYQRNGASAAAIAALSPVLGARARLSPGSRLTYAAALWSMSPQRSGGGTPGGEALVTAYDFAFRETMLACGEGRPTEASSLMALIAQSERDQPAFRANLDAEASYRRALIATQAGQDAVAEFAAAAEAWRSLIGSSRRESHPLFAEQLRGEVLLQVGKSRPDAWGEAEAAFRYVAERDVGFVPARTELAKLAMERGDLVLASAELEAASAVGPSHRFIPYVRAELRRRIAARVTDLKARVETLAASGALADAADLARSEPDLLRLDGQPNAWAAQLAFASGRFDLAAEAVAQALALDGETFDMLVLQARIVLEEGDPGGARCLLSVALGNAAAMPQETDDGVAQGQIFPYSGSYGRALASAAYAWSILAAGGNAAAALREVEGWLSSTNLGGETHYYLARVLQAAGDEERAERQAAAALQSKIYGLTPWQIERLQTLRLAACRPVAD